MAFDVALTACPVMHFYCGPPMYLLSGVDKNRAGAEFLYYWELMADDQHRAALADQLAHFAEAFRLKSRVPNRQHLVDEQDVRVDMRGYREAETKVHTA